MDAGVMVPLGVFAMLVAGWYIQSRMAIAHLQALAQERVAAIEKGVPLPPREPEPPEPPVRAGHPLKPTLSVLAVGIALWIGLSPRPPCLGYGGAAFGIAGLVPLVYRREGRLGAAEGHGRGDAPSLRRLFEGTGLCLSFGRWPQGLTIPAAAGSHEEDLELARRCGSGDAARPACVRRPLRRPRPLHLRAQRHRWAGPRGRGSAESCSTRSVRCRGIAGASRLSTWIYSLALRRVADHFRSPQRRDVPSGWPGDDSFPPPQATPSALAPDEQAVRREEDRAAEARIGPCGGARAGRPPGLLSGGDVSDGDFAHAGDAGGDRQDAPPSGTSDAAQGIDGTP